MANHLRDGQREAQWRGVMARFAASGLSVRAFCQRERLPESAFYFWRRTLLERDAATATRAVPSFVLVSMRQEFGVSATKIDIEMGEGLTIRFEESASPERIATLVRALRSSEAQV